VVADDIPGWFTFRPFYEVLAADAPPGSTLVEVGVFCGKSLAYLAANTRGKGCRVLGVDTFRGSPEFAGRVTNGDGKPFEELPVGILAQLAVAHLTAAGVIDDVTLLVADSVRAAESVPDGSAWAVFLDGDHGEESVRRDIRAWWPKVAPGGLLAGDDFGSDFPGVERAVRGSFTAVSVDPTIGVWAVRKVE
jgi:hypothetical protein